MQHRLVRRLTIRKNRGFKNPLAGPFCARIENLALGQQVTWSQSIFFSLFGDIGISRRFRCAARALIQPSDISRANRDCGSRLTGVEVVSEVVIDITVGRVRCPGGQGPGPYPLRAKPWEMDMNRHTGIEARQVDILYEPANEKAAKAVAYLGSYLIWGVLGVVVCGLVMLG
jgi:hypothetical protein